MNPKLEFSSEHVIKEIKGRSWLIQRRRCFIFIKWPLDSDKFPND